VRVFGLHVAQGLGSPDRPSALAEVAGVRVLSLELLRTDAEIESALPTGAHVLVDAPLWVPEDPGSSRDLERVLAWCDIPLMPVTGRRLDALFGGRRGVLLAERLGRERVLAECAPDAVLRQLTYESLRADARPVDLAGFRTAWLELRPPRYRPKGAGRARPSGLAPAAGLIAHALDLGGWSPRPHASDLDAIDDAARLDALVCALVARRALDAPGSAVTIGAPGAPRMVLPVSPLLLDRLEVNVRRLREEGAISPAFAIERGFGGAASGS